MVFVARASHFTPVRNSSLLNTFKQCHSTLIKRSYATFNPKQSKKLIANTTLALCSKFRDSENREHVLSTASLTCVATQPAGKYHPRLHFISTTHVTHPFLFPKYYPKPQYDWVHKLTTSDVWATAQLLEAHTGKLLHEIPLGNPYIHPTLDMVVLHPEEELKMEAFQELVKSKGLKIDVLKLYPNVPILGQHVFYYGHNVDSSVNVAYPTDMTGITVWCSPERIYASVENPPIPMGMCGGPVVLMQDIQQCIGMVEASVAPLKKGEEDNEVKAFLQDKAVIIPATVISKFLQDVDNDLG
eukprot:Phypoly_transcript_10628.p1 GENE.Phypoly_transcript_10628~~Phypoly_transcript_10628.p1  ORF type:complete len:300 (+),score=33.96 Phypoly_transcript_10628:382-1281(+)